LIPEAGGSPLRANRRKKIESKGARLPKGKKRKKALLLSVCNMRRKTATFYVSTWQGCEGGRGRRRGKEQRRERLRKAEKRGEGKEVLQAGAYPSKNRGSGWGREKVLRLSSERHIEPRPNRKGTKKKKRERDTIPKLLRKEKEGRGGEVLFPSSGSMSPLCGGRGKRRRRRRTKGRGRHLAEKFFV